jgi:hypothetical protein
MKKIFYTFFLLVGVGLSAEADVEKKEVNATTPTAEKVAVEVAKEEVKKTISLKPLRISGILVKKWSKIIFFSIRIKIGWK